MLDMLCFFGRKTEDKVLYFNLDYKGYSIIIECCGNSPTQTVTLNYLMDNKLLIDIHVGDELI